MKLYFVRHGESEDLAAGKHQHPDSPLSEGGITQARAIAERVEAIEIDRIITSPYKRALHTAELIAEKINKPLEILSKLAEQKRPSLIEGQAKVDVREIREEIFENFGKPGYRHSDEESFEEFRSRARDIRSLLEQRTEENLLIVTHGNILRVFLSVLIFGASVSPKQYFPVADLFAFSKAGMTVFDYDLEKGWKLITWNDHSHLG